MKGEHFERLITLIENSLATDRNIKVQHNVKIEDKDGIKRQIDVLIEINYGKRFGKQIVIVECKDWNSEIEVGHMGAFINLVESVNAFKGIYVSKKGFQSGAIKKAKGNSKIILKTFEDINKSEIIQWIDFDHLIKWMIYIDKKRFYFDAKTKPPYKIPEEEDLEKFEIVFPEISLKTKLYDFGINLAGFFLNQNTRSIFEDAINENGLLFKPITDCFTVERFYPYNEVYLISEKGIKYPLFWISTHVGVILTSEESNNFNVKKYIDVGTHLEEAAILNVKFKRGDEINIVKSSSSEKLETYYVKNSAKFEFLKFRFEKHNNH